MQKSDAARSALSTGHEAGTDNSRSRKRAASSSNGSAMDETTSEDHGSTNENFAQQTDTTHAGLSIACDEQAGKLNPLKQSPSSNDGTAMDEIASDDYERQPPLPLSNILPQLPKSIIEHKMEHNLARVIKWSDEGPEAYLSTPAIRPVASQSSSSCPSLPLCETVIYQYPHSIRYSAEIEDVDLDPVMYDLRSQASDDTVIQIQIRELVDHAHLSRVHSTGGRSDGAASSSSVTLHQPEAIRKWTRVMIKEVSFTFAEVESIRTAAPEPEPEGDDLVDPADAWYADLTAETANEEIEVEYVGSSPGHRESNRILIADPRLEWLATILA